MPLAPADVVPPSDWVIFGAGAESILKAVGNAMTPELAAALKREGLDPAKAPLPAYAAPQFEAWLMLSAGALFPNVETSEAQRRLGQRFFENWKGTLTGAAATAFLRVVGLRRALGRVGRVFRHGNNFTVTETTFTTETTAHIDFLQTQQIPDFVRGVLEGGLSLMEREGRVSIIERRDAGFVLEVTWAE